MSAKESEHISPALEALKAGNYRLAIDQLQRASSDVPAVTSDNRDDILLWADNVKITRMRILWLLMIAQRLDGRLDEAYETFRQVGFFIDDPTIAELVSDELFDILLARAEENDDRVSRQMLLDARPD